MKSLGRWILLGMLALACYGALRPVLIVGTSISDTLFKATVPIAIGVCVLVGIIMAIAFAFSKKGGQ